MKWGYLGLSWSLQVKNYPARCEDVTDYEVQLLLIWQLANTPGDSSLMGFIDKCQGFFSQKLKMMLALAKTTDLAMIRDVMKSKHFDKVDVSELNKILKKLEEREKRQSSVKQFVEIVSLLQEKKNIPKQETRQLLRMKLRNGNLYDRLVEILVFFQQGNKGRGNQLISEMIKEDPLRYFISLDVFHYSTKDNREKVYEKLHWSINYLVNSIDDQLLKEVFLFFWKDLIEEEDYIQLTDQIDADWPVLRLQKVIQSPNYGLDFFNIWIRVFHEKVSPIEFDKLLVSIVNTKRLRDYGRNSFWIYRLYYPPEEELRKEVEIQLVKQMKINQIYENYVLLTLAKNKTIKKVLGKYSDVYKKPFFKISREFFKENLEKGVSLDLSSYQLLKLGDKSESILWWLAVK